MEKMNMTIKEIVELTQVRALKDIATDLPVSEKVLRETLKAVGCVPPSVGKRGWTFEPDNAEVEKDLGEFVKPSIRKTKTSNKSKNNSTNASIDKSNNDNTSIENNIDSNVINNANNGNNASNNNIVKGDNMVMEIKDLIKGKGKDDNARVYKGIYFDKDIAHFLDNVQKGNKSEIVNKILRQYLVDNELM
jgi:hypothetical protein